VPPNSHITQAQVRSELATPVLLHHAEAQS
jgi:hypothetical protein